MPGINVLRIAVLGTILCAAAAAASGEEPQPSPAGSTGMAPVAPEPVVDPAIDRVLTELEEAGAKVQSIRCQVEYVVKDNLNMTETTKKGQILFRRGEPHPMFKVEFNELNADGTLYKEKEWWILRERWLWEAKAKSKTTIKREIAAPGETIDLFDLEKSPVPIPFGQKKAEILANFVVQLQPPQMGDPADSEHLYCKPKEGVSLAKEFSRLEYYLSKKMHLPVKIVAQDAAGTRVTTATFTDLAPGSINIDLPESAFTLPVETKDFSVTEEPLRTGD
jgi:hypothetical protein